DNVYQIFHVSPVNSVPSATNGPPSVTGVHVVPSSLVSAVTLVPDGVVAVQSMTEPATVAMSETSIGSRVNVCDGLYPDVKESEIEATDGVTATSVVANSTRY